MTPEKALRIDAEQAQIKNIYLLIVTDKDRTTHVDRENLWGHTTEVNIKLSTVVLSSLKQQHKHTMVHTYLFYKKVLEPF